MSLPNVSVFGITNCPVGSLDDKIGMVITKLFLTSNPSVYNYMKPKKRVKLLISMGREYKCAECGIQSEYNGKPLTLQVDHIDGNNKNDEISNLRFICPNCHSQTHNWCAKNRNKTSKQSSNTKKFGNLSRDELQKLLEGKTVKQFCEEQCIGYVGFIMYLRTRNIYIGNHRKYILTEQQKEYIVSQISIGVKRKQLAEELGIPEWTFKRLYYTEKLNEKVIKTCKEKNIEYKVIVRATKISWPPIEVLIEKLSKQSYVSIAKELKVSDNSIRKYIRKCGYDPKTLERLNEAEAT